VARPARGRAAVAYIQPRLRRALTRPFFSGKAKVYIPLAGWEIEAPVFSAPYAIHAQPRRVSPRAVGRVNTIIEDLSNLVARGNRDKR